MSIRRRAPIFSFLLVLANGPGGLRVQEEPAAWRAVAHRNGEERRRFTISPLVGPQDQPGLAVRISF